MAEITIKTQELHQLKPETAWHYQILPKERTTSGPFELYYNETQNAFALEEELSIVLGCPVRLHALPAADITRLLGKYYQRAGNGAGSGG